jgi:intein/homing endonuclease
MKTYTQVTRSGISEDRIAICPKFGCREIKKIKPLKFGFIGFGKYPKCKKHYIPLVFVDERIGDFVDGALACLFDNAGLPPRELLSLISSKFTEDFEPFVQGWVYCITIGRGAQIVSQYIDSITKTYLKKLTRKQLIALNDSTHSKAKGDYQNVIMGMQEITKQYTRLLKHLRIHSEIISDVKKLRKISNSLKNSLFAWQNISKKEEADITIRKTYSNDSLTEVKQNLDSFLNIGTCRCLLGLAPQERKLNATQVTAFERFSAYYEFYVEGLTKKFTRADIENLSKRNFTKSSNPSNSGESVKNIGPISINNIKKEVAKAKINANELILIYNADSESNELVELSNAQMNQNTFVFGLDKSDQLKAINSSEIIKKTGNSYYITCKHGMLSLSERNSLLTVDDELNIISIPVKSVCKGMSILMPRFIHVDEDRTPLDFSNCGEVIEENGIQYVKKALTKVFRFVEKNFELGYILGQYCAEGSMNVVSISCGNNKSEMEKVAYLVEKVFGYKPFFTKNNKEQYKTVYSVESNTQLIKLIFTQGLCLKPKHAPFKEIPPFLYNAPLECVKGFILGFTRGDGSIGEYIRKRSFQSSPSRDIDFRLFTSSRRLAFGLSFLLKRLRINAEISKREFDNEKHPTYYDAYSLRINGKTNLDILRKVIPGLPEFGKFSRGKTPSINLNHWIKILNTELKDKYKISLRMLVEKKYIPTMAAKCAQENNKKNISEGNLLKTLDFLQSSGFITPTINKLRLIFENYTFTKVKAIEFNHIINNIYCLSIPHSSVYLLGIGQIFVN